MTNDPIGAAARRSRRLEKLRRESGMDEPMCVLCTESRITVLQSHHVVGRTNDERTVVVLCFNCHQDMHARLRNDGVTMKPSAEPLEILAVVLAAIGRLLVEIGNRLNEWAQWLHDMIRLMDTGNPDWRTTYPAFRPAWTPGLESE